jgi:hypothetical protein
MDLNKDRMVMIIVLLIRMNDVNSLETQALVKEKKKVSFSLPVS